MKSIILTTGVLILLVLTAFRLIAPPSLFVVGDSISIQYGPYLENFLAGRMDYDRKQDDGGVVKDLGVPENANGGDSRMVLEYLREKVKDPGFSPGYLLLNCGLHDIKRNVHTNELQVKPDNYEQNLQAIIDLMTDQDIQVIWIRTTQVVDTIHNARAKQFKRYSADQEHYNQIADQVMNANNIPAIDLYEFTKELGVDQFIDHVHYNERTRELQGAFIAGYLSKCCQP